MPPLATHLALLEPSTKYDNTVLEQLTPLLRQIKSNKKKELSQTKKREIINLVAGAVKRIVRGEVLTREQSMELYFLILQFDEEIINFYWGIVFGAIQARGVTADEIMGFVDGALLFDSELYTLLQNKRRISTEKPTVAITGSGKEDVKTFNVSTIAAIVASSLGVVVVKPCSRSTSATSGSTDVLIELGIDPFRPLSNITEQAQELNICFVDYSSIASKYCSRYDNRFYHFHILSYIMPPLCIPVQVDSIVYGIADKSVALCSQLLFRVGYQRGIVVTTEVRKSHFIDELAPFGTSLVSNFKNDSINIDTFENSELSCEIEAKIKQTGNNKQNAQMLIEILQGNSNIYAVEIVSQNAGLILYSSGLATSINSGIEMARKSIIEGRAYQHLINIKKYFR